MRARAPRPARPREWESPANTSNEWRTVWRVRTGQTVALAAAVTLTAVAAASPEAAKQRVAIDMGSCGRRKRSALDAAAGRPTEAGHGDDQPQLLEHPRDAT